MFAQVETDNRTAAEKLYQQYLEVVDDLSKPLPNVLAACAWDGTFFAVKFDWDRFFAEETHEWEVFFCESFCASVLNVCIDDLMEHLGVQPTHKVAWSNLRTCYAQHLYSSLVGLHETYEDAQRAVEKRGDGGYVTVLPPGSINTDLYQGADGSNDLVQVGDNTFAQFSRPEWLEMGWVAVNA